MLGAIGARLYTETTQAGLRRVSSISGRIMTANYAGAMRYSVLIHFDAPFVNQFLIHQAQSGSLSFIVAHSVLGLTHCNTAMAS